MAGSKSNYLENALLDHVFGGGDYARPATLYIALFTVSPGETGIAGTEVSGGSYQRLAVTNNPTNFPAASGGSKSNGTTFTFVTATASWGTVAAFAVMDDPTSGNELYYGDISTPKLIDVGDTAKFNPGDLSFSED
jgi:hypothetical protein